MKGLLLRTRCVFKAENLHVQMSEKQTINMEYQAIFGFLAKIDNCICKLQVAILGSKRIFTVKLEISPSQGNTNKIIS